MEIQIENADQIKIESASDTYGIMRKIFFDRHEEIDILKEHFWTVALNRDSKILAIELVSMGSNGRTIANPPEVFRIPLHKSASQVVLVHNHPSEPLRPSEEDLDLTNRLIQAGLIMDIEVVDHVIVTKYSYYSFCDSGLIEKLRWDNKYALTFIRDKQVTEEIAKIKKEVAREKLKEGIKQGIEEGEKQGAQARNRYIAKNLLKKGIDISVVKDATGLTAQWIGRLKSEIEEKSK